MTKYKLTFANVEDRKEWVSGFRYFLKGYREWKDATTIYIRGTVVYIHLTCNYTCIMNKVDWVPQWEPAFLRRMNYDIYSLRNIKAREARYEKYKAICEEHKVTLMKY